MLQNVVGQVWRKDSGHEDLTFAPVEDKDDTGMTIGDASNKGIIRIDTSSIRQVDKTGEEGTPQALQGGQRYHVRMPESLMDDNILSLCPLCRCCGPNQCATAQVYIVVDGKNGDWLTWQPAAHVWQCVRNRCGFQKEMEPDIFWHTLMPPDEQPDKCTISFYT